MKIENIIGDYKLFLDKIFTNLATAGFLIGEFKELDHIAYRTESRNRYEEIKKKLLELSVSFSEIVFSGRPITVCKLQNPLVYKSFEVNCVELCAPKENNEFEEGLEHAEFVVKTTLEEFKRKHKDIKFNYSAFNRKVNSELIVIFDNCAVKFHTQSLLGVKKIN